MADEDMKDAAAEDDPVVRELDVFICNEPVGAQLCVLSCPLRPIWRPYEYKTAKQIRIKPIAKRLEVDLPLDTSSVNFNKDDEENGGGYKQISQFTLRSTQQEQGTMLAMGTVQDGKLLLAPIDNMLQLRPTLNHLNVKKGKDGDDAGKEEGGEEEEEEMKAVEVQVQKRETERQQQARLNSYAYLSQKEEEEPWKLLRMYADDSRESESVWSRLTTVPPNRPPHTHLPRETYLHSFAPSMAGVPSTAGRAGAAGPSSAAAAKEEQQAGPEALPEEARPAFAEAMKALFGKHSVCSMANVRHWLADPGSNAGAAKAAATLPDRALHELVLKCGVPLVCIRRMYVLKVTGKPEQDAFRKVVIDLLMDKETFKKNEVTELANAQGVPVTDSMYMKVVRDLCQSKAMIWSLKNGAEGM